MKKAHSGDWVRIHDIILTPQERASRLPGDTRDVPLEMWVKGVLEGASANIGDRVTVQTAVGRRVSGILEEINPSWNHGFGQHVPELDELGRQLRHALKTLMAQELL